MFIVFLFGFIHSEQVKKDNKKEDVNPDPPEKEKPQDDKHNNNEDLQPKKKLDNIGEKKAKIDDRSADNADKERLEIPKFLDKDNIKELEILIDKYQVTVEQLQRIQLSLEKLNTQAQRKAALNMIFSKIRTRDQNFPGLDEKMGFTAGNGGTNGTISDIELNKTKIPEENPIERRERLRTIEEKKKLAIALENLPYHIVKIYPNTSRAKAHTRIIINVVPEVQSKGLVKFGNTYATCKMIDKNHIEVLTPKHNHGKTEVVFSIDGRVWSQPVKFTFVKSSNKILIISIIVTCLIISFVLFYYSMRTCKKEQTKKQIKSFERGNTNLDQLPSRRL